jgi:hypothetical protein
MLSANKLEPFIKKIRPGAKTSHLWGLLIDSVLIGLTKARKRRKFYCYKNQLNFALEDNIRRIPANKCPVISL